MNKPGIFDDLTDDEFNKLLNSSPKQVLAPKTVFINQEEVSETAYFILEGSVSIYRLNEDGEEVTMSILGKGDVVGEMAFIDHNPRSAYAKTLTKTEMIVLTNKDFQSLIKKHPEIALNLLSSLTKRIRTNDQHIEDIVSKNLHDRLWSTLQSIQEYFPDKTITLTHEELAAVVGATRARITEALNDFQKVGKIELAHKKIRLI